MTDEIIEIIQLIIGMSQDDQLPTPGCSSECSAWPTERGMISFSTLTEHVRAPLSGINSF